MNKQAAIAYTMKTCNELLKEKEFHRAKAVEYFRLFNDLVPEDEKDGHPTYSMLQVWLQVRTEHHVLQMFNIDAELDSLQDSIENAFPDAA